MKQTQILLFTAVCGAVLAMTTIVSADTIKSGFATVVRIQGEARYSLGDDNWHPLVAGKTLAEGAVIQTGHDGIVDLVLGKNVAWPQARSTPDRISFAPDYPVRGLISYKPSAEQNMVRLSADTTLQIDKLTVSDTGVDAVSDTELNLKQGHIFASVLKLSAVSQYLIKIPNGIAGVRGTVVSADANDTVAVLSSSGGSDVVLSLIKNGVPATYPIGTQSEYDPSAGQVVPIPPALLNELQKTADALKTAYFRIVSFAVDSTTLYTSVSRPTGTASSPSGGGVGPGDGGIDTTDTDLTISAAK
jgi:FecR protein